MLSGRIFLAVPVYSIIFSKTALKCLGPVMSEVSDVIALTGFYHIITVSVCVCVRATVTVFLVGEVRRRRSIKLQNFLFINKFTHADAEIFHWRHSDV